MIVMIIYQKYFGINVYSSFIPQNMLSSELDQEVRIPLFVGSHGTLLMVSFGRVFLVMIIIITINYLKMIIY